MTLKKRIRRLKRKISAVSRSDVLKALLIMFCFPLGLYFMWSQGWWQKRARVIITSVVGFVILLILLPVTDPPARQRGGITVIDRTVTTDAEGPAAPENRTAVDIYVPQRTALIIEATATPEPTIVYCNIGGQYYHNKGCRFVKTTTPSVTLAQAVNAGYTPCPECDAPAPIID